MATTVEITCFTDLKGSTALTEQLGHQHYMPLLLEHLRVGKELANQNSGEWVKNIGDAHLIRFTTIEGALNFSCQLQQLCSAANAIPVRVALHLGAVEPADGDVFGSGVNQGARQQGETEAQQVTVNAALYDAMAKSFSRPVAEQLCESLGEFAYKGITDPPKQVLYDFKWKDYISANPRNSASELLLRHLQAAGIEASNFTAKDLEAGGQVIWPVVPRALATAIHRGQIELMRLMHGIGWKITVLIAECGEDRFSRAQVIRFVDCLRAQAAQRGIAELDVRHMNDLYEPDYERYKELQQLFREITTGMSVAELMAINNKDYAKEVTLELEKRPTLTHLRAPLTMAAVLHLAKDYPNKCAIVSGSDERAQWKRTYNIQDASTRIGALMIPKLRMDRDHQVLQRERWPIWDSEAEVLTHIGESTSNAAWWLFCLFRYLPQFPAASVDLGGSKVSPASWADAMVIPMEVDKSELVSQVWPLLNPA